MEKKVFLQLLLCGIQHSVIMADFLMLKTQQPIIVIIFIIYSPYFLKYLIELYEYISGRIAISTSFYVSYKQLSSYWSFLIDQATQNDTTSLTTCTYTTHSRVCYTNITINNYIYNLYTLNPMERNHRDCPTGNKNGHNTCIFQLVLCSIFFYKLLCFLK